MLSAAEACIGVVLAMHGCLWVGWDVGLRCVDSGSSVVEVGPGFWFALVAAGLVCLVWLAGYIRGKLADVHEFVLLRICLCMLLLETLEKEEEEGNLMYSLRQCRQFWVLIWAIFF